MPKATTIYDTLSYTEPITSSNPMVDVKKSLAQLDAPLKEIDDYDPLQINTLNVDRGVAGEYSNEQNNNISGLASSGDIWGAASKAKGLAKKSAREQKDIHHKAGAAAYNLTTQKADEARELKRNDVSGNVLNYNNLKSQRLYAREGGIGTYDESGRSTNLGGFNRYNSIISTPTVDTSALIKKYEEGWKASGSTETTFGGQGTKYIDKTTNKIRYVKGKDVHSYVANGLLSDDQWVKSNSESIEADMYEKLAPSMGNDGAIDYLTSPEAQAQIQQQVSDRANRQARGSSDKIGFYTNDELASRTNDSSWGRSVKSTKPKTNSTLLTEAEVTGNTKLSSASNIKKTIQNNTTATQDEIYSLLYSALGGELNTDGTKILNKEVEEKVNDYLINSGLVISKEDFDKKVEDIEKRGNDSKKAKEIATNIVLDEFNGTDPNVGNKFLADNGFKDLLKSAGLLGELSSLSTLASQQQEALLLEKSVNDYVINKDPKNSETLKTINKIGKKLSSELNLTVNAENLFGEDGFEKELASMIQQKGEQLNLSKEEIESVKSDMASGFGEGLGSKDKLTSLVSTIIPSERQDKIDELYGFANKVQVRFAGTMGQNHQHFKDIKKFNSQKTEELKKEQ